MKNDAFSDLTGLSSGPKPMRANKAPGLKQQKNVLDLLTPQPSGSQPARAQAPYTPTPELDLSDLEQLPTATTSDEPAADAFDLLSDLALPSANGAADPVEEPVSIQEEPQPPALPEIVQVDRMLPVQKTSQPRSPQKAPKPNPATHVVNNSEYLAPPPPAYSDLVSRDATSARPVLASAYESDDSLGSPQELAPTVFIHVDDDPARFPYREPPPLPKPAPTRSIPKSSTAGRRGSAQSASSAGARGSPKRKPSSTGRSPPQGPTAPPGHSPTRAAAAGSSAQEALPSLLDASNDAPVATSGAPPAYGDLLAPVSRTHTGTGTMSSASSNAYSALPPSTDLLADYGVPGDLLSAADGAGPISAPPGPPVATARDDASGASGAQPSTADLLGGGFENVPEASPDLLGAGDFVSAAPPQRAGGDVGVDVMGDGDVFGFGAAASGASGGAAGGLAGAQMQQPPSQVGDGFDDDFFAGGAAGATHAAPAQLGGDADVGADSADSLTQLGGGGASSSAGPRGTPVREASSSRAAAAAPQQGGEVQVSGDVLLQQAIANAQEACMALPPERVSRVQGAIAQAPEYVAEKTAEKLMQAGTVTDKGLHFAKLSACKTAASILTKTVEHHQHEAQQEADVAEAFEYRDSIKADIKAWAFQGGTRLGLRNLLVNLDKVLWEGAKWKRINLADVSTDTQVKKVLNKARLLLHTDKMARQPEKIRLRAELILIEIDKALKGLA